MTSSHFKLCLQKRQFWLESLLVTDALTQWCLTRWCVTQGCVTRGCVTRWLIDAWHTDVLTHVAFAVSVNLAKSLIGSSVTMYLCHSTTLSHRHIIAEVLNYNWTFENGSDRWKILWIYSNVTKRCRGGNLVVSRIGSAPTGPGFNSCSLQTFGMLI